jgi:hypothetical protein
MAVLGYLMFGAKTKDETTTIILTEEGYPKWLTIVVLSLISIDQFSEVRSLR